MCFVESATGRFFRLSERNTRLLPGSTREAIFSNLSANPKGAQGAFGQLDGECQADARPQRQERAGEGCCLCDASHASASVAARKTRTTRK